MARLREENQRDRQNIMRNAILLAGTTIIGVVAEKVITYFLTKNDETSKKIVQSFFRGFG